MGFRNSSNNNAGTQISEGFDLNSITLKNLFNITMDARIDEYRFSKGIDIFQTLCESFYSDDALLKDLEAVKKEENEFAKKNKNRTGNVNMRNEHKRNMLLKRLSACLRCLARNGMAPEKEWKSPFLYEEIVDKEEIK